MEMDGRVKQAEDLINVVILTQTPMFPVMLCWD